MAANKYAQLLDASPAASRARDIVAALTPPVLKPGGTALAKQQEPKESWATQAKEWLPGIAGAVVGAFVWKRHRILGGILGHAVASNAMPIIKDTDRTRALTRLGVESAIVYGALRSRRHPVRSGLFGAAAGLLATGLIAEDSDARVFYNRFKTGV